LQVIPIHSSVNILKLGPIRGIPRQPDLNEVNRDRYVDTRHCVVNADFRSPQNSNE